MTPRATVFGFGSFFRADANFHDVDLLVVHDDNSAPSCRLAISCKQYLVEGVSAAHVTMLSENEERQLNFVQTSSAVELGQVGALTVEVDIGQIVVALRERMRATER